MQYAQQKLYQLTVLNTYIKINYVNSKVKIHTPKYRQVY